VLDTKKTIELKLRWEYRMSSVSGLQGIINETKTAFVIAKFDGKLEAAEVVQIATDVALKVHKLSVGSPEEKKALVALALKRGLAASGGLLGLGDLAQSGPGLAVVEKQVLDAALAAVDGLMTVAPQLFAPAQSLLSALRQSLAGCLPFCSQVAAMAKVLDPKDAALISEALETVKAVATAQALPPVVTSTLESVESKISTEVVTLFEKVVPALELKPLEEVPDTNIVETEPSLEASHPELPVSPGLVEEHDLKSASNATPVVDQNL
jgi:hypothetical protein